MAISITKDDVRRAQERHKDTATEVAAFFDLHNHPKPAVEIADASSPPIAAPKPQLAKPRGVRVAAIVPTAPAEPQLTSAPQQRHSPRPPAAEAAPPSDTDRGALNALVTLASLKSTDAPQEHPPAADRVGLDRLVTASANAMPTLRPTVKDDTGAPKDAVRVASLEAAPKPASIPTPPVTAAAGFNDGWAPAPEFDDDHPDEVSYRPFPIAPLLTEFSFCRRCCAREARAPRHRADARAARRSPCRFAAAPAAGRADAGGGGDAAVPGRSRRCFIARAKPPLEPCSRKSCLARRQDDRAVRGCLWRGFLRPGGTHPFDHATLISRPSSR